MPDRIPNSTQLKPRPHKKKMAAPRPRNGKMTASKLATHKVSESFPEGASTGGNSATGSATGRTVDSDITKLPAQFGRNLSFLHPTALPQILRLELSARRPHTPVVASVPRAVLPLSLVPAQIALRPSPSPRHNRGSPAPSAVASHGGKCEHDRGMHRARKNTPGRLPTRRARPVAL